jgi:hypothetical protein
MQGLPYCVYTDMCDYGLAGILQQVQPITIKDLKGMWSYDTLRKAYDKKEKVPNLVANISKADRDVPPPGEWSEDFEDTIVHVERVICYWSHVLKSAEWNYSLTERKALALKESLINFQPFLEGEKILAITDHATLTWSKTFQNVNQQLLTWGTVFSAYLHLWIVHRAGRVHSNIDLISQLQRCIPPQNSPLRDGCASIKIIGTEDSLWNMYAELGPQFEERLLKVASHHMQALEEFDEDNHAFITD